MKQESSKRPQSLAEDMRLNRKDAQKVGEPKEPYKNGTPDNGDYTLAHYMRDKRENGT